MPKTISSLPTGAINKTDSIITATDGSDELKRNTVDELLAEPTAEISALQTENAELKAQIAEMEEEISELNTNSKTLTGLSSVGLSGTPTLNNVINAMSSYDATELILQPSEAYGFLRDTSSNWGTVMVTRASGEANTNRNSYVYVRENNIEGGMWANGSLYNYCPNLGRVTLDTLLSYLKTATENSLSLFIANNEALRSVLSGGDTTNSMRGMICRVATDQNDYLVYTASGIYFGRLNDSGTATACRKATATSLL